MVFDPLPDVADGVADGVGGAVEPVAGLDPVPAGLVDAVGGLVGGPVAVVPGLQADATFPLDRCLGFLDPAADVAEQVLELVAVAKARSMSAWAGGYQRSGSAL